MSHKQAPTAPGMPQQGAYPPYPQHSQQYPGAPPTYDQAMAHPTAHTANLPQAGWHMQHGQQPVMYQNYQSAAAAAASAQNYQQQMQAAAGYPGAYAPTPFYSPAQYQMQGQHMHNPHNQPTTIVMPGVAAFDGGARFNGISQPVVPPAPPGIAPNAAQVAAMSGHNVVLGQKKGGFLTGSSTGGGFTFW
ncbi:DAZ-associated protein 2-like isoform X2 [Neocloeon triangulifer]|uniref:DAZ-associated protein 2-like isoform X2 n=1 Tax=Neocloeon triangulifer TaxID=2078957 RepID=UPI00286F1CE1|nr:DAZ-associated protein 2-like isoform X2 [Neocloeon triangulifer]